MITIRAESGVCGHNYLARGMVGREESLMYRQELINGVKVLIHFNTCCGKGREEAEEELDKLFGTNEIAEMSEKIRELEEEVERLKKAKKRKTSVFIPKGKITPVRLHKSVDDRMFEFKRLKFSKEVKNKTK